jgi:putative redox protein
MAMVRAELHSGTRATISVRQFTWLADEPPEVGGTDEGPNPYETLLGGLAACIAITLRLYANHKGIQLEGVGVNLEFDRVHADDCLDCDSVESGMIDRIRSSVTIQGSFDAAQKKRLAQVAERCPVHRTLTKGMQIFDTVAFESPIRE